jgi:DNA polymerase-3 subunit epsilon
VILAFDTETTGLPDFRAPSDAPNQPHLVQLAMVTLDDDMVERASVCLIIRPDGWEIPADVAKIHGITTEIAFRTGVLEKTAVDLYVELMQQSGDISIAHNISFDRRIMRIAMLRNGYARADVEALEQQATFCTMTAASPIVNLPPTDKMKAAGFTKPKPPRLTECIKHFFDEDLTGAHDALVDVRACVRVYRHLVAL